MTGQHLTKNPNDPDIGYIQSRAEMNYEIVDEYAKMMKSGIVFDEVEAIIDDGHTHVYDGAHRFEAAKKAGVKLHVARRPGTKADAEWAALAANAKHGLRRSNATKRRVTKNALLTRPELSDRAIAQHCQVDHKTVGKIRADLVASGEIPQIDERTVTRNGKTFTQAAKSKSNLPVSQLEPLIKEWLNDRNDHPDHHFSILMAIKEGNESSEKYLDDIDENTRGGPHTRSGVRRACNNLLDQMTQERVETRKTQPTYTPIPQLEQGVQAWLGGLHNQDQIPDILSAIKARSETGQGYLSEVSDYVKRRLDAPHRRGELRQACNNVAEQMEQKERQEKRITNLLQLEDLVRTWLNGLIDYDDKDHIGLLTEIKQRSDRGEQLLSNVSSTIKYSHETPHERSTLRQACNNVLTQLRHATCADEWEMNAAWQQRKAEIEAKAKVEAGTATPVTMRGHWSCGRCKETYPPGPRYNVADFDKGICAACLNEISGPEPKPEAKAATDADAFPTFPGCSKCGATEPGTWWQLHSQVTDGALCWNCSKDEQRAKAGTETITCATCDTNDPGAAAWYEENGETLCRTCYRATPTQIRSHCGAHAYTPTQWVAQYTQGICPDCLHALGLAMIQATNENGSDPPDRLETADIRLALKQRMRELIWAIPDENLTSFEAWLQSVETMMTPAEEVG